MTTIGLCLKPLDVLFFRDGRPFTGAERSVSGLPLPQTVAGAIRTALLRVANCDFKKLGAAMKDGAPFPEAVKNSCAAEHGWIGSLGVRGPWLARRGTGGHDIEVFVPAPATLRREKRDPGKLHRLSPLPKGLLPGWDPPEDQEGLRPLWLRHLPVTERVSGYLNSEGLEQYLRGAAISVKDIVRPEDLFGLDYRTGIGIAPDRLVAEESQIFGRGFLALEEDVFLYAEAVLPNEVHDGGLFDEIRAIPLGGEGRHATLHRVPPFAWPNVNAQAGSKPFILLTTPCAFEAAWKPRALNGHIVSAAVPGSLAFSGWDMARGGPKPTRFAAPAGSVYYLDSMPDCWAGTLAESDEDSRQGWGCCLKGVWSDE